jgi:uncharacterized protein YjiK
MRNVSALSFHERTGHLLVLSYASKLLVEYGREGEPFSMMPLWRCWHGLSHSIPHAEGVATDPDENIYIVSEPNLFYRFERQNKKP